MSASTKATETRIIVAGPRPLRDALIILGNQLGCLISFEEPDYRVGNNARALFEGGPVVPLGGEIDFTYSAPPSAGPEQQRKIVEALLANVVDRYPFLGYTISTDDTGILNVVPVKPQGHLTDTKISVSIKRTYGAAAAEICMLATMAGGTQIDLDHFPSQRFFMDEVAITANAAPLRDVLNALAAQYSRKSDRISWKLTRDPEGRAVVRFHHVSPARPVAGTTQVFIEAVRPLAVGTAILQRELGQRITYEDPHYSGFKCEALRSRSGEPQIPRGGILNFAYAHEGTPEEALHACVQAFEKNVGTGRFDISRTAEAIHVYPVATRNDQGEWISQKSILESPLSISDQTGTGRAAIEKLSTALSLRSGTHKVVSGEVPDLKQPVSLRCQGESARLCLDLAVRSMGDKLSWQLFFDISKRSYVINVVRADQIDTSICF